VRGWSGKTIAPAAVEPAVHRQQAGGEPVVARASKRIVETVMSFRAVALEL
jgi:hypothetical protein